MEDGAGPAPGAGATGEYRVADEVVAQVAALAAGGVAGVAGLGGGLAMGLGEVLSNRHGARGVRVQLGSREAAIDLYLSVAYGVQIPVLAQRVQEAVKSAVESMTALRVVEVNVHVLGVVFQGGSASAPEDADRHGDAGTE